MNKCSNLVLGLFERESFPVDECTIQDEREPEVFSSYVKYFCLIENINFKDECRIQILMPYVYRGEETMCGWTDGYNVYDHFSTPIHDDDELVIGWALA